MNFELFKVQIHAMTMSTQKIVSLKLNSLSNKVNQKLLVSSINLHDFLVASSSSAKSSGKLWSRWSMIIVNQHAICNIFDAEKCIAADAHHIQLSLVACFVTHKFNDNSRRSTLSSFLAAFKIHWLLTKIYQLWTVNNETMNVDSTAFFIFKWTRKHTQCDERKFFLSSSCNQPTSTRATSRNHCRLRSWMKYEIKESEKSSLISSATLF